jgi:hypothetical protein
MPHCLSRGMKEKQFAFPFIPRRFGMRHVETRKTRHCGINGRDPACREVPVYAAKGLVFLVSGTDFGASVFRNHSLFSITLLVWQQPLIMTSHPCVYSNAIARNLWSGQVTVAI